MLPSVCLGQPVYPSITVRNCHLQLWGCYTFLCQSNSCPSHRISADLTYNKVLNTQVLCIFIIFRWKCSIVAPVLYTGFVVWLGCWFGCFAWANLGLGCGSFSFDLVINSYIFHRWSFRAGIVYQTLQHWGTQAIIFALISLSPLRLMQRDVCAVLSSLDIEGCNNKYDTKKDRFVGMVFRINSATLVSWLADSSWQCRAGCFLNFRKFFISPCSGQRPLIMYVLQYHLPLQKYLTRECVCAWLHSGMSILYSS